MNKELEALKRLYMHLDAEDLAGDDYYINDKASKDFDIIKKSLEKYSKHKKIIECFDEEPKLLRNIQNVVKALEIIKEELKIDFIHDTKNNEYWIKTPHYMRTISKEKYDLLKEVML